MKAKNFSLLASNGKIVSLEDFKGKNVIVYFYPKDNTPGCTTEACSFRDSFEEFQSSETIILGISKDSIKKHNGFIEKHNLPFLLLSDEDGKVCEDYGVWQLKKMMGKEYMGIVRSTFLIEDIIINPTRISTGAVAAPGTAKKKGARNKASKKQTAVTKAVRPLRPPSPTPEALSTKVVIVLVPNIAPTVVPTASTKNACFK